MKKFLLLLIVTGLSCLLASCAPPPRGGTGAEAVKEAFSTPPLPPRPAPQLPPSVVSALMPPVAGPLGGAGSMEPRFDIAASKTPAQEFFMSLVEGTPYNMVVHPEVSGTLSLAMKNATVADVLEVVRNVYGYPFRQTRGGFQVLPAGMQSRVFHVNYLNLTRKGVSQTRVSSGQVSESQPNDDGEGGNGGAVSGSQINTESQADFWAELEVALKTLVGTEQGRKVVVQPQAGVVVVRAMPEELQDLEQYLATIQGNLQRQVILEAKILEVVLNDGFQTGINWATLAKLGSGKTAVIGQTGGGSFFDQGVSEISGNTGTLNPLDSLLPEGTDTSAFGGVFSAALNLNDFTAFIELLETQGDVQILSSPRVATVNNQKAVIKVGSDEFFVTDIDSDTVTGTTTSSSTDITLTPFFSGIALDVTPQIDPRGQVTLHVHPTVSEVTDQQKTVTIGEDEQVLPLAFSTVRESDSIVSARSGQVVVIGGLMQDNLVPGQDAVDRGHVPAYPDELEKERAGDPGATGGRRKRAGLDR